MVGGILGTVNVSVEINYRYMKHAHSGCFLNPGGNEILFFFQCKSVNRTWHFVSISKTYARRCIFRAIKDQVTLPHFQQQA